jgi:4-amino-4-deoxy-L-arabinose transferase-like glycosyltransferase
MQHVTAKADIKKESLYIGLLALLLFTLGLWDQPFVEFESRFALFAHEMWRHGPTWFPTTYSEPYPDYPGTSTFFIWLCSLPFGGVTKLSAVLPTAIASALTLAFSYHLLARYSRLWALATVCFEVLTLHFLSEARSISLDQMVTAITLLCFHVAFSSTSEQRLQTFWLGLLMVIGFAIRGPLGVVIPAGVVSCYYLLSAQWKKLLHFALLASCILLVCWLAMLALTSQVYGHDFMQDVIHMQVAGRMDLGEKPGHWYYFTSSMGNYAPSYPVAVVVILLLLVSRYNRLRKPLGNDVDSLLFYLVGWALVVLAGLSIPDTKKIRYILPMVPAISALAAYPFCEALYPHGLRAWTQLRLIVEKLLLVLPAVALAALWKAFQYAQDEVVPLHIPFLAVAFLLIVTQALMSGLQWRKPARTKTISVLCGSAFTVWMLNLLVVEPAKQAIHDTHQFVARVEALRLKKPGNIAFFRVGKDGSAIKYLVNLDYDLQPEFLMTPAEINTLATNPVYLILSDENLPLAQQSTRVQHRVPVLHDLFNRDDYTVFYLPAAR